MLFNQEHFEHAIVRASGSGHSGYIQRVSNPGMPSVSWPTIFSTGKQQNDQNFNQEFTSEHEKQNLQLDTNATCYSDNRRVLQACVG